jgi:hypothetical protein
MKISTRQTVRLAADADVDPRTVEKAFKLGIGAIRGRASERLTEAAQRLGIALPVAA